MVPQRLSTCDHLLRMRRRVVLLFGLLVAACADDDECAGSDINNCPTESCSFIQGPPGGPLADGGCLLRCADGEGEEVAECPKGTSCSPIPGDTPDDLTRVCLE